MKVLLTGATGFVGSVALKKLIELKHQPVVTLRVKGDRESDAPGIVVGDINADTDWSEALQGCAVVIHAAGRAHVMKDASTDPLSEFRKVNTFGTLRLAQQSAQAGIKRFVFISSIKVNGEFTKEGHPFRADDSVAPADPYGVSKYEAETGLAEIAKETGMEIVIIRPPLVYGPGVKGNFVSMMRWLHKGIPLPLGAINNQRSLVSVDNLVDLLMMCMDHPNAVNQTFLVSDNDDLSTTLLLSKLAGYLQAPSRLLPLPGASLMFAAKLLGKKAVAQRLLGSLQLDITKTRELLDWSPPVSIDDGLRKTAQHFLNTLQQ